MAPRTAPPPFLPAHYYSDPLAAIASPGSPKCDSAQATVALNFHAAARMHMLTRRSATVGHKSRVAQLELLASRRGVNAGNIRSARLPVIRLGIGTRFNGPELSGKVLVLRDFDHWRASKLLVTAAGGLGGGY
jgi:hypothetical protein